jgi:hypothetical protein
MQELVTKNSEHASNDTIKQLGVELNKHIHHVFHDLDNIKKTKC